MEQSPAVAVGESEPGNGNLLIGDAKQSIYRFRNADPSLIADKVERQFSGVRTLGDAPSENTNWRSDPEVVEFNNGFSRSSHPGCRMSRRRRTRL